MSGSERATAKPGVSTSPAVRDDSADIGRASERLNQQARGSIHGSIDSAQQARARVAQLQLDVARHPQQVVDAFRQMTPNAFSAAIAEPSD